uniref:SDS3 n=1 Tax=Heterorhabditis bacteriophora TaxID=37862 RepID=A0A1I7WLG3_HETBA
MELTCPSRRSASARPITSTPQKTSQSPGLFPTSFNDSWPQSLTSDSDQRIAELEKELALVDSGQHPKYLAKLKEFQRKQEDELEMIEIMYEREKEEIERKYQLEHEAIQKELAERQEELVQTMLQEVDERIRFIEAEVAVLDVAGPACPTFSMNKKSLRRSDLLIIMLLFRPHDTPTSTEKKRARMAAPPIIHLLPEHIIAEDVKLLAPAETIPAVVQHHKVSIENGKLIYEGKT